MVLRKLRKSDFDKLGTPIKAVYNGNSRYLISGYSYYVTLNELSGKVTVQAGYNPGMATNGGVQFSIGTFLIEEENKMVRLEDLTPEDQERLLNQARQIIDEENIQKDAITAYKIKKKEFVEQCLEDIYKALHMRYESEKKHVKQRYTSLVNYLFKLNVTGKQYTSSPPNVIISTATEWNRFVAISNDVKDTIIRCYNLRDEEV